MTTTNRERALRYLQALEAGAVGEALAEFFHPEVQHREYPSRLFPHGVTADLKGILQGAERGQRVVGGQRFTVRHALSEGDSVAMEVDWSGTLKVPMGTLPEGTTLRAAFGMFLTFREGRIISQRNYDCYEPF